MRTTACFSSVLLLLFGSRFQVIKAQEAPFYNTPKFDTSVTHRTNLCDRQQALFADNISLSDALEGLELSVVLTNYTSEGSKPFFSLNKEGTIDEENPGLFAIVMDELAKRAKFTWRNSYGVVLPIDSETDGNKTWSDLLEWGVDTYDISAGKWDRSLARMKREVSFPEGWYDSSMILVHAEQSSIESLNIWSFLLPFEWNVWLLLGVTILVTAATYFALEKMDPNADTRDLESHPGQAVFYTAITFTGHFENRPSSVAAMILTFSTTFVALIIGAVYTANLASFLVASRAPSSTIQTVEEAVLMEAPICVQARVNIDDYITEKYPRAVLIRADSKESIPTMLKEGKCSVAVTPVSEYEQFSRYSSVNGDCNLKWIGRVENIVPAGFASHVDSGTLCTSLISHVIDLHMIQMKTDGFLEREWQSYLTRTGDHTCIEQVEASSGEEETFSLGVQEMAGIFIIHAMLLGFAVIVALLQYYGTHYRELSKSRRHLSGTMINEKVGATDAVVEQSNGDNDPECSFEDYSV